MKKQLLIILILLLAFVLRFYRLGSFPALNADEVAIGYNAYSLIQTGQDEHGNSWPIHFESFGDYKPGLYFYLAIPFIKAFGLNEWAVRIPGALLGVATVFIIYLLANLLFKKIKKVSIYNYQLSIGEIAAFLLTISPWHIHFSRGAWEANVATFFITTGVYFFLRALINPEFKKYALCILSFTLSLYTYHSARVIVPLLCIGIFLIHRRNIRKNIRYWLVTGLLGIVILIPLAKDLLGPAGISRASGVTIFADPGVVARINEQRGRFKNPSGFWARALHNKPINYSIEFIENWIQHYSPQFLFISGDEIQRNKVPGMGQMYLFESVFVLVGIFYLLRNRSKGAKLILWWLLIAPFAAAITFQSPHALRAQNMVIPITVVSSLGFYNLIIWLRQEAGKTKLFPIYMLIISIVIVLSFVKYLDNYWNKMAREYPFSSQYGVKELINYITQEEDKNEKIIVTSRYDQPYILFLFYMKYPPAVFQKNHELTLRDKYGFSTVANFDKYYFQNIDYTSLKQQSSGNFIIVGTDEDISDSDVIKDIYGTNGYRYFQIAKK